MPTATSRAAARAWRSTGPPVFGRPEAVMARVVAVVAPVVPVVARVVAVVWPGPWLVTSASSHPGPAVVVLSASVISRLKGPVPEEVTFAILLLSVDSRNELVMEDGSRSPQFQPACDHPVSVDERAEVNVERDVDPPTPPTHLREEALCGVARRPVGHVESVTLPGQYVPLLLGLTGLAPEQ